MFGVLKERLRALINEADASYFLVGNNGSFDRLALRALRELEEEYPHISFCVVLAYLPKESIENSIYPEGLENVPQRFCIDRRNRWMLERADYVIGFITRSIGGAAKFSELAVKQKKTVINIADFC